MTRARDFANVISGQFDLPAGALDNAASDVVSDTTPQLGGNLDANGNNINFGDNDIANFGDSADMSIFHNGFHSIIKDNGTGNLELRGQNVLIRNTDASEKMAFFGTNGATELYYNNVKKVATTSSGASITGDLSISGTVTKPNQVAFSATPASANYITTSPIPFSTATINIGNHFNTSNYTFTAPIDGRYFFHLHLGILRFGTANGVGYARFEVNGSGTLYSYVSFPSAIFYVNGHITAILNLSANDTVKVQFNTNGNADYYGDAGECVFQGYLLG